LKAENGHYRREASESEIEEEDFTAPQVAKRKLAEEISDKLSIEEGREHVIDVLGELDNSLGLVDFSAANNQASLRLEPDGFEVAHERELTKKEDRTNRVLTMLTAVLAFSAIIQAQSAYLQVTPGRREIFATLIFLIGGAIGIILYVYDIV
jgi:hypothetical protein